MPHFTAEHAQAETAFDTVDRVCPGKPEAHLEYAQLDLHPGVTEQWWPLVDLTGELLERASGAPDRTGEPTLAVAKHRLLGIYLV